MHSWAWPWSNRCKFELRKYTGFKMWFKPWIHTVAQWCFFSTIHHEELLSTGGDVSMACHNSEILLMPSSEPSIFDGRLSMSVILHSPVLDFFYWTFSLIMSRYNSSQSFFLLLPNKWILMNFAIWLHSQVRHEYIEQHALPHWPLQNSTQSSTSLHCEDWWFIPVLWILSSKQLLGYTRAFPLVFSA